MSMLLTAEDLRDRKISSKSGSGLRLGYLCHTRRADSRIANVWIHCHFEGVIKIHTVAGSGRSVGVWVWGVEKIFPITRLGTPSA